MLVGNHLAWRLETLSDGIALIPRDGLRDGAIRIRERVRPLRSARQVFAAAGAHLAATSVAPGPIEPIVTCEGEHAAFQELRGLVAGEPFLRCLGAVFGDDFYALIDAATTIPARFEMVARTARTYTAFVALGLGHRRVRRFGYRPPAGWQPQPRGLDTCWLAPTAPVAPDALTVYAARPVRTSRADVMRALVASLRLTGAAVDEPGASAPVFAEAGLSGTRWFTRAAVAGPTRLEIVVLEDERFVYPLVARGDAAIEALAAVARTVQPVPLPTPIASQDAMLHWST